VKASEEPYKFDFEGGSLNSYIFSTENDVRYEIKFVPSTDFFPSYAELDMEIFEMVISVLDKPMSGRLPADSQTAPTIFAIFWEFFQPHRHALIFICDSSDGRELARHRKFGQWFYQKTKHLADLTKMDRQIIDGDSLILLSLIMSRLHPKLGLVVEMFVHLGTEDKQ
jgi:hypothetical protein